MAKELEIQDLHVSVEGKEILKGINLTISKGEVHAVMGPNGSGKSTLANTILGHPHYEVTQGDILYKGRELSRPGSRTNVLVPGCFSPSNIRTPFPASLSPIFCAAR